MHGSRIFFQGGWGGSRPDARKQLDVVVFCPQLILQRVQWFYYFYYYLKLFFSKGPEGSNIFQGDPMLISTETHIACDFPGWWVSGPPIPPSGSAHESGCFTKCLYISSHALSKAFEPSKKWCPMHITANCA